jgi:hypothetical protein
VLEQGAGHIEAVLLLRELEQLAVDDLPPRSSIGCGQESADLAQREADVAQEADDADFGNGRQRVAAAPRGASRRSHQPELVVVAQRGRRHAGLLSQLPDRQQLRRV